MTRSGRASVLIVDDDPQVRQVFSDMLEEEYRVLTADSGETALEVLDDDVDVVVLDRRMPGLVGEDVLRLARDEGYRMPVAIVTAVDPDFDVLEMGFDEYVVKPITPTELREVVETMLLRKQYDDVIREYYALVSKATALQATKSPELLDAHDGYHEAEVRLEAIKEQAREALDAAIEAGKFDELFKEFGTTDAPTTESIWAEYEVTSIE